MGVGIFLIVLMVLWANTTNAPGGEAAAFLVWVTFAYLYLTLLRGMSFEEDNLRWGEMALRRLAQRAPASGQ